MKAANQKNVLEFIKKELEKKNLTLNKLNYKKGKLVIAETDDGDFLFTFNRRLELLTKL